MGIPILDQEDAWPGQGKASLERTLSGTKGHTQYSQARWGGSLLTHLFCWEMHSYLQYPK